jgi:3-hydroxyisobutyrate dehydrogenase-like beta-hydroxyacid dehydrogenase
LASECRVIFSCLLDGDAVEQVYLGSAGLLEGASAGSVLVEHGTFDPAVARRAQRAARKRGADFLDAPVTGGPEGAAAGSLVAMVGGSAEALAAVQHPLSAYAGRIAHVGDIGAGLTLKIINQFLVAVNVAGVAEAAALVRSAGIDAETALSVLSGGWGASAMLVRELPRALSGAFDSTGATIEGLLPTVQLAAAALSNAQVDSRVYDGVRKLLVEAIDAGIGGSDPAALISLYGSDRAVADAEIAR